LFQNDKTPFRNFVLSKTSSLTASFTYNSTKLYLNMVYQINDIYSSLIPLQLPPLDSSALLNKHYNIFIALVTLLGGVYSLTDIFLYHWYWYDWVYQVTTNTPPHFQFILSMYATLRVLVHDLLFNLYIWVTWKWT